MDVSENRGYIPPKSSHVLIRDFSINYKPSILGEKTPIVGKHPYLQVARRLWKSFDRGEDPSMGLGFVEG